MHSEENFSRGIKVLEFDCGISRLDSTVVLCQQDDTFVVLLHMFSHLALHTAVLFSVVQMRK